MSPLKETVKTVNFCICWLKPTTKVMGFYSVYLTVYTLDRSPQIYLWVNWGFLQRSKMLGKY